MVKRDWKKIVIPVVVVVALVTAGAIFVYNSPICHICKDKVLFSPYWLESGENSTVLVCEDCYDASFDEGEEYYGDSIPNSNAIIDVDNEIPVEDDEQSIVHINEVPDGYIAIYSAEDLQNISKNMSADYILMNDIYLSDVKFTPFEKVFEGSFEGNNYVIYDYFSCAPLFPNVNGASIKNLSFKNAEINLIKYADDIYIDEREPVGGIVGEVVFNGDRTEISNCSFEGKIESYGGSDHDEDYTYGDVGGIVGCLRGKDSVVSGCYFDGEIRILNGYKNNVGGIVGESWEECRAVMDCHSSGEIYSNDKIFNVGGISGSHNCDMTDCYSNIRFDVNLCSNLGGIVGFLQSGKVEKVYFIGEIFYTDLYSGKPMYWGNETEAEASKMAGNILGDIYAADSKIQYCYYSENGYEAVGDGTPYANVTALSEADLKKQASYNGFDFDLKWTIGDADYPYPVFYDVSPEF